ncbi:MAG: hypothetical protein ACWGQW_07835 [bacterium]
MATGLLTRGLGLPESSLVTGGLGASGTVIVGIYIYPDSIATEEAFGVAVVYNLDDGGASNFPRLGIRTLSKVERRTIR